MLCLQDGERPERSPGLCLEHGARRPPRGPRGELSPSSTSNPGALFTHPISHNAYIGAAFACRCEKQYRVHHSVGSAQKRHKIYPNGKFPFSFPFECMQCSPPGQVASVRPPSLALLARSVAIQPCDVLVPGGGPCIQGGQDVAACARSVAIRCETWPVEGLRHPEPSSVASQSSDQGIAGQCGSCLRTR